MASPRAYLRWAGRNGKRVAITVVGGTLVLAGLAGLVLPIIPGWLLLIPGLAILGTEYVWAQRILETAKKKAKETAARVRRKSGRGTPTE